MQNSNNSPFRYVPRDRISVALSGVEVVVHDEQLLPLFRFLNELISLQKAQPVEDTATALADEGTARLRDCSMRLILTPL